MTAGSAGEMPTVLYLTYHGLASPLGRAQCLPYLLRLAESRRARLLVVSWESDPVPTDELRRRVRGAGIEWVELRYLARPKGIAKLFEVAAGLWASYRLTRRRKVDAIHARTYIPMAVALVIHLLRGTPVIFDMLGMLADEYVDIGNWPKGGLLYRVTKYAERLFLRAAAATIVLTDRSAEYLRGVGLIPADRQLRVIPCCVDLERFRCSAAPKPDGPRRLVYSGGLGGWYLTDEMVAFFAAARELTPDLLLRVVTRSDHELVRRAVDANGVPAHSVEVLAAAPDEINALLCSSDVGLCFIAPMFSKHAASPNKFAEYLACGLPVIANRGIGDLDRTLDRDGIGVVVERFDRDAYRIAWSQLLAKLSADEPGLRARCRAVAERDFAAERAVNGYDEIYRSLMPRRP